MVVVLWLVLCVSYTVFLTALCVPVRGPGDRFPSISVASPDFVPAFLTRSPLPTCLVGACGNAELWRVVTERCLWGEEVDGSTSPRGPPQ